MKYDVIFDLDGVLGLSQQAIHTIMLSKFPNLPNVFTKEQLPDDITEFYGKENNEVCNTIATICNTGMFYDLTVPVPIMIFLIQALKILNLNVACYSHAYQHEPESIYRKEKWVEKFYQIPTICCKDKEKVIDDCYIYVEDVASNLWTNKDRCTVPILIRKPWNMGRELPENTIVCEDYNMAYKNVLEVAYKYYEKNKKGDD